MATNDPFKILTYANLSNAAYSRGTVPIGWSILTTSDQVLPNVNNGFSAIALRNEATGEIVVSYRGTDGVRDLTGSDFQLALQNDVPEQYNEAQSKGSASHNFLS
jgi:hypothetical protein